MKPPEASAAKKYCIYCGSEMPVEGMYCPRCGKKQVEEITGTKEAEAVAKLQKPAKMGFLDRLRGEPDVKILRERGDVEELVKALSHRDYHVRSKAAEALGELRDRRAVPALIRALEDDHWDVRGKAIKALGIIKDPDSVIPLLRILQDPREAQANRCDVAEAFEQIKDPRGVQPLSSILKEENHVLVEHAVRALGAIGGSDSVEALKSALERKEWGLHYAAVKALERIRETSTDPSIRAYISAALEKAKKDRSEEYRKLYVLEALKSVESYRVTIFTGDLTGEKGRIAEVRWPNFCCLCLGPVEQRIPVSDSPYRPQISVGGVPYCKFCYDAYNMHRLIGEGVTIRGNGFATLSFKNPEYGRMFMLANPQLKFLPFH